MRFFKNTIIFICFLLFLSASSSADTLYLKNDQQVKGIVVENYQHSIILSTADGERRFKKSDIKDIVYDRKEQNMVKLGDYYQQNKNLSKAYYYYKKAYELNPDYKEAREKFFYVRSSLLRNPEKQFNDDMERKRAMFKESGKIYDPEIKYNPPTERELFEKSTGLVLVSDENMPKVSRVIPSSPADRAGIEKNDIILSVWGRLTGYLDIDSIISMIMRNASPEITLSIKREIIISAKDRRLESLYDAGFTLDIPEQGITVESVREGSLAGSNGLAKRDIVLDINGESVRYMPFDTAKSRIVNAFLSGNSVTLTVARDIVMWRKEK